MIPDVCDGERTMVPSGAHAAPRGFPPTSVIATEAPPATGTFRSQRSAKKPSQRPSGEKKG
jgi:hypothetical protein